MDGGNISAGFSPLLRLAGQLAATAPNAATVAETSAAASDPAIEVAIPNAIAVAEIETFTEAAPTKETCETKQIVSVPTPDDLALPETVGNIANAFSPLLRLADQLAGPAPAAIPNATAVVEASADASDSAIAVAPTNVTAVVETAESAENETFAEAAPTKKSCDDKPAAVIAAQDNLVIPVDGGNISMGFSPLVRLADQLVAITAGTLTNATAVAEVVEAEDRHVKDGCAVPPATPNTPAEVVPEVQGPRLPATPDNGGIPLENKLFDPNLLDEPPLDLETRIRNSAPPEQFAPQVPLEAPRPLAPMTPIVAATVPLPVVDSNRRFLDATVPADISRDARPFLRDEELAIASEPGLLSQMHLGDKLTLDFGGIGFGLVYDDNYTVSNGVRKSDTLLTISSGLTLTLGNPESKLMLRANYNASGVFFLNHSSQNAFDQSLSFDMYYRMQRLTLGLHIRPSLISGSSVDAGDRIGRKIFYSGLTANYALSEKTSISLNADYTYAGYNGLLSSRETRVQAFVNHQVTPKITIGLGGGYGALDVDGGQTQTSEQALMQISYTPTAKLAFNASAGWEFRNGGNGVPTSTTPVFSVGAAWTPREKTTISVDARRRTYGSAALVGQNYEATGISATITQQLRPLVSANLTVGYEFAEYQQALVGVDASRKDKYFYARAGMGFPIGHRCTANVFYEFSNNTSTGNGARAFDRNRVGMFLGFKF